MATADPPEDNAGRGRRGEFKLDRKNGDDLITRNLKKVYEEVAAEPVPDALMALLNALDEKEGGADD